MRWRRTRVEADALADETDAFLHGHSAEHLESSGQPVPVWAWMNLLAHGSLEELRCEERQLRQTKGWRQSRAFLAGEIVDLVDDGRSTLDDLQRDLLVPLELDIIDCPGASHWTPGQIVQGLLRVLPRRSPRIRP